MSSPDNTYQCWSFEESYMQIDKFSYLLKLSSGFSTNDIAGRFNSLDKDSNPIVLDINTDIDSNLPFGFKFSSLKDIESKANDFFDDIKNYIDISESDFFGMKVKQELIDLVEINKVDILKFNTSILDKIYENYFNNKKFDINADSEVSEKFSKILAESNPDAIESFLF